MSRFDESLDYGMAGESAISRWLRNRGHFVLPAYEKLIDNGKGPRVYGPRQRYISPDLLVWKTANALWVEAKHKTAFSWHRMTQKWVTGVDLHHYDHYCKLDRIGPWPVWLLFLHDGGQAKDSPANSPAGLFGNHIHTLSLNENHRHDNWGNTGMVYWSIDNLIKMAESDEVRLTTRITNGR